ncbi:hypothetical protein BDZ90DRAFT_232473 [Jaminaea rosea]|uniref:Peptidase S54 rhomboid domain-containing protein n=1 Tax=Jaminaea rosea TaxID=1569628 RepID=A0A316UQC2_9BASI|nr:hypothetical protein BDZ90DRAFT_232473 [Jaminaea rosea]PWN27497.1 hypothetical protein BDZ90DRAFT_232473 [Jaminaea rosea]
MPLGVSRSVSTSAPLLVRSDVMRRPGLHNGPDRKSSTLSLGNPAEHGACLPNKQPALALPVISRPALPAVIALHQDPDYATGEGRVFWVWLSLPFIFVVPLYLSYKHDKHLVDLATGKEKPDDGSNRVLFPGLKEGKKPDRQFLDKVWRRLMAEDLAVPYKTLMRFAALLPRALQDGISQAYAEVAEWYLTLPTAKMAVVPIIAVNTAIYTAWMVARRRPAMLGFMMRNFTTGLDLSRPWTVYLSPFSHTTVTSLVLTSGALWYFSAEALQAFMPILIEVVNKESETGVRPGIQHAPPEVDYRWQLLAAFLFASVGGRLASRFVQRIAHNRLMLKAKEFPPLAEQARQEIAQLRAQRFHGAWPGVYGVFGGTAALSLLCIEPAQCRIGISALMDRTFPYGKAFKLACSVHIACLVMGFRRFDHAAHVGGALCGWLWVKYVEAAWLGAREGVAQSHEGGKANAVAAEGDGQRKAPHGS